jgi:putative nucleotidyltransferase with HDIG domain
MKILFVDDEFIFLEGLQLRLLPICQDWEMEFAQSGAEALGLMNQKPFDAIVADLRMPGMSGLALLEHVMSSSPGVVRILLADPVDAQVANPIEAAHHQWVVKNRAPEDLKAIILRACGKEEKAREDKLEKLMAQVTRLPSIPSLYFELIELMRNPNSDINAVGAVIAKDMTMTAAVLKMANSAFFGLQRVVTSTAEATMYLGVDTLRSLVLSVQIFSQFEQENLGAFSVDVLSAHSLETAAAAKAIAQSECASKEQAEEAFVTGVLHDIGKLVLASNFPERYDEVLRIADEMKTGNCLAEWQVFGVSHAAVGGRLLQIWGIPQTVVEAVMSHHEPCRVKSNGFSVLTALHAANVIVHEKNAVGGISTAHFDMDYLNTLGLAGRLEAWRRAVEEAEAGAGDF